jgi:hypothetical protein
MIDAVLPSNANNERWSDYENRAQNWLMEFKYSNKFPNNFINKKTEMQQNRFVILWSINWRK